MDGVILNNGHFDYLDIGATQEMFEDFLKDHNVWVKVTVTGKERGDYTFRVIIKKPGASEWTGKSWKRKSGWVQSDSKGHLDIGELLNKVKEIETYEKANKRRSA